MARKRYCMGLYVDGVIVENHCSDNWLRLHNNMKLVDKMVARGKRIRRTNDVHITIYDEKQDKPHGYAMGTIWNKGDW
jgi:hypothetical protein